MARGYKIVVVAPLLVEGAKLYQPVAHHVGVGRQPGAHLIHGVARHLVPVFAVAVNHLEPAPVTGRHGSGHLQVFFRRTIPL